MALVGDISVKLGLDVRDFKKGLQESQKNMKRVGNNLKSVGTSLATGITAPLAGVGLASAKVGADFERSMKKVQAVTGSSGDELGKLEAKARDLGSTTKYSANEVADSMGFLGMAGYETGEILKSTGDMLNLATISGMELGQTADITSNILSGMGMDADQTGRLVDTMAYTMTNANTNVSEMGEAMKMVAPVASDLGIGVEELSGAVGFLSDAGMKGSQAGTQLATGLTRLASPTDTATEMMQELGIEAFDAEGKLKSLPEVLGELEGGFKDLNPKEKTTVMKELFGQENIKGWNAMLSRGGDELKEFSTNIANAEGAGQELSDTMGDTLYGRLDSLRSALSEVGLVIYDYIEPALKTIVENATKVVQWLGNLDGKFVAVAVAIGAVMAIVPMLLVGVGSMITVFSTLVGSVAGLIAPVTLVIAGLVALGAGLAVAWQKSETFRNVVKSVFSSIKSVALEVFEVVSTFVKQKISEIKAFWDENGTAIQQAFEKVVRAVGTVFETVFPIIKSIVMDTISIVMDIIDGLIQFFKGFIMTITNLINGDFAGAWESFKQMVSGAVKAVWGFIKLWLLGKVMKLFGSLLKGIKSVGGKLLKAIKKPFNTAVKRVRIFVKKLKRNVTKKFTAMKDSLSKTGDKILTKITSPFKKGWEKIKTWIDKIKTGVKNIFSTNIKKPSFGVSGSLNPAKWATQGLPKLKINWNAKGNIFDGASILGGGQGVGEAGAEAVMPIEHKRYMKPFSSSVAEHLKDMEGQNDDADAVVQNTFNISSLVVREEADVQRIADELERIQRRQQRAKGKMRFA
ncbi:phage tail tape measure protein [Halobacillus karajensis]|uniref:phage tail tape measure protein n=1 Tax=Halobacillus karajensis TaxID=195088 RepID=UPI00045D3A26|nr:phage tail tape measure protein [Halobacillus karajensis]CDQ21709.1 phage tail tape measure protein, TP901 family, core region [Halobacillus karajensis]